MGDAIEISHGDEGFRGIWKVGDVWDAPDGEPDTLVLWPATGPQRLIFRVSSRALAHAALVGSAALRERASVVRFVTDAAEGGTDGLGGH